MLRYRLITSAVSKCGGNTLGTKYSRKYPRISADFGVDLTIEDKAYRERASAVGGGGLFLSLKQQDSQIGLGAAITVRFRAAKHLPVIQAKGKVCYVVPGEGAAVEFTEISADHRRLLLRLIHSKTGKNRKSARASLATQVQCQQCVSIAFSRDVSPGGMFIETPHPLPVGSVLSLRFNLDDQGGIVVVTAEVVYHAGNLGMGVQFRDVSPEDQKRIEEYVAISQPLAEPTSKT